MPPTQSDEVHPAAWDCDQLLRECVVRRVRRSGPGGQHRNKVETGVVIRHQPTGVAAEASERRSLAENQRVALTRLRINLALNVRLAVDSNSPPSRLWQSRCQHGRIAVSPSHADFPPLLAEALDTIFANEMDVKASAQRLSSTSSQLIKLLKSEPSAITLVNTRRHELGMHRLK